MSVKIAFSEGTQDVYRLWDNFTYWIEDQWSKRPLAVVCFVIFSLLVISTAFDTYEERKPFKAFTELFLAQIINFSSLFGGIFAGYIVGKVAHSVTSNDWVSFAIGFVAFVIVGILILEMGYSLDGVGWRIKLLRDGPEY